MAVKLHIILFLVIGIFMGCNRNHKQYKSPPGYNLLKPEKIFMGDALNEISGLAFNKGKADTIYAVQDEDGKLFHFKAGEKRPPFVKFGKKGDYEDMAISNNYAVVLRSDGTLFTFPLRDMQNEKAVSVKEISGHLPGGEYEGLCATDIDHRLVALCKQCENDKAGKSISGYTLQLGDDGNISPSGNFQVSVEEIKAITGNKKMAFRPSGISQHPVTKEWYILSSVNKLLVVADTSWKIKAAYSLKPSKFRQPEGIAFDADGNLYISNEGGELDSGDILKFSFDKNK